MVARRLGVPGLTEPDDAGEPVEAAWIVLEERLRDLAELGLRCREVCSPLFMPVLNQVTAALAAQADELAAAR